MRPAISVFTAARDIGRGIETAWRSLLRQTRANWEWVVLDDSVERETADHLERLAKAAGSEGRLRVERPPAPTGSIGAAKAAAAALCRGEVLVELDHDDELTPDALEIVGATFDTHGEIGFAYSDWIDWVGGPGGDARAIYPPGWGFGFGAHATEVVAGRRVTCALAPPITWETIRHIVAAPNHLRAWRAGFYRRIGGHDPGIPVGDDYELVVRSFLAGAMARIPRPLYVQQHDPAGRTASRRRNAEIQARVEETAEARRPEIDRRCLELGAIPSGPATLTSAAPIPAAQATLDVRAEEAELRGEPLVSVIVPTFGRPQELVAAIESALAQTYSNLEVLVVGDGCPDVDEVVFGIGDPRVRHWNLTHNHGDSGAAPRNYALKTMARGSLIAYLDDDNTWSPDHLESLVALLIEDPDAAYAFSSFEIEGEAIACRTPRRFQIDTNALLHRRSLLDRYGYWRPTAQVGYAHDWELVSRWHRERWAASLRPTARLTLAPERHGELEMIRAVAAAAAAGGAERPRIAVYAIARDEEARVEAWARSARDADAILLADTGSSDETVSRARAAGVEVHKVTVEPFRFDVAFNRAVALVDDSIDVCVRLDLDEELTPEWREQVEAAWRAGATKVRAWHEWRWSDDHPPLRFRVERIHARRHYHWEGAVHEWLVTDAPEKVVDSVIHLIHRRDSHKPRPDYLELLRVAVREHPADARLAHMLANEHRMRDEPEEAREGFLRALALDPPPNERLHSMLMLSHLEPRRRDAWLTRASTEFPDRREPWCELAELHAERGDWARSREAAEAALAITRAADDYLSNPYAWGGWPERLAARAASELDARVPLTGDGDD